jgi:hypothetical protein
MELVHVGVLPVYVTRELMVNVEGKNFQKL